MARLANSIHSELKIYPGTSLIARTAWQTFQRRKLSIAEADAFSGCQQRRGVCLWSLVKFLLAAGAAKVIGPAAIFREVSRRRWIHAHFADRVRGIRARMASLKRVDLNGRLFASPGQNNFGKDTDRNL